jgi:hypothetical protein
MLDHITQRAESFPFVVKELVMHKQLASELLSSFRYRYPTETRTLLYGLFACNHAFETTPRPTPRPKPSRTARVQKRITKESTK